MGSQFSCVAKKNVYRDPIETWSSVPVVHINPSPILMIDEIEIVSPA